ncbi:MAG: hypothetical protein A3K19_03030 [Lentisphaerae bacterium RIFOXYB12_FULL_65_16]|nr:MAG: hypothetical protein A3K18_23565 [Lentisphaerae bacterium RIFOXYA12_64_32]OGV92134.1 MAG: hypothetical protein A3K19_03030 [Lentisphaerae bacterium RIFOXYB12_FULL_65_16]
MFYDFVSSYDTERRFDHLPTTEEIKRQYPNTNGWGTGMEDSMISAGVVMSMLCDRYDVTGDESLRELATDVFTGMARCATVSHARGFLTRSISPRDGTSYYIECSRDQYTHFVHGLWRFHHSALPSEEQRNTMRGIMAAICERMETFVVPANDFHFCREDGTPGLVDKMWECDPHEVARLPMIYAVGWDVTGDRRWWRNYCRHAWQAALGSTRVPLGMATVYAYLQEAISLEPLVALEVEDPALRDAWAGAMKFVASRIERFSWQCLKYTPLAIGDTDMNWRHWPESRREMTPETVKLLGGHSFENHRAPDIVVRECAAVREPAEALLVQCMAPLDVSDDQRQLLRRCVGQVDYDKSIAYGLFYCLAAYWKAVKRGILKTEE